MFDEHGLDARLEEIARRADVSVGTIYNRFGSSREGLIDAVVADIAAQKLDVVTVAIAGATPWERFTSYVVALGESQVADPAFNEMFARRSPEATALQDVNNRTIAHGEALIIAAQRDGSLRSDVTATDIDRLIWLNAQAERLGVGWWRRGLEFFLDGIGSS
ncbi:TetR/AcrR family transcriptional regulator [Rhodococcus sp. ACT016]|uniref:TetR/AcrR family transcriptional regulator n=1 Tax=Rhodococcus sp. ACT016 TaxID=3134808 RepID=UPI003D2D7D90